VADNHPTGVLQGAVFSEIEGGNGEAQSLFDRPRSKQVSMIAASAWQDCMMSPAPRMWKSRAGTASHHIYYVAEPRRTNQADVLLLWESRADIAVIAFAPASDAR
jgi:hypothetical protein